MFEFKNIIIVQLYIICLFLTFFFFFRKAKQQKEQSQQKLLKTKSPEELQRDIRRIERGLFFKFSALFKIFFFF